MRKLAIISEVEVAPTTPYPVPVSVTGLCWSKLLSPPQYRLWLCLSEVEAGGALCWPAFHGDEALYVFAGSIRVGEQACPAGGAVIVEAGTAATVDVPERARIAHWGARHGTGRADDRPAGPGGRVHVVGPSGSFVSGDPSGVGVRGFAAASCPGCRLSLFEVTRRTERAGRPHSHSADEIIFVTAGTVRLGALELGAGTSLCIPGGTRYAEGSGPGGAVFINYRPEASDRTDFVRGRPPTTTAETLGVGPDVRHTCDVADVASAGR